MNLKELQKNADQYTILLNTPEYIERHQKDLKGFIEFCKSKILGDPFAGNTGCRDFNEYKYWLGRYHNSIEILLMPDKIIQQLEKEKKEDV